MAPENDKPIAASSSRPPFFHTDQEALFRGVLELLEGNRVRFAISGAFALHEYTGIWRDTKDLDLFLPATETPRALELLQQAGFHTEIPDPVWLAKAKLKRARRFRSETRRTWTCFFRLQKRRARLSFYNRPGSIRRSRIPCGWPRRSSSARGVSDLRHEGPGPVSSGYRNAARA